MRIAVVGGYGVFGSRLVRLLARDGHDVFVVGRRLDAARAVADEVGAVPLALDRDGDLEPLWDVSPEAVVDAAGPFHAYGDDPYHFARECIAHRIHYLDLADDQAFCKGIAGLDALAREAGVFALSGASSVPAISSAAVTALSEGAEAIDCISSAILPGNRAPRGASVVRSILHQCGRPMLAPVDGQSMTMRSWSDCERIDLGQGLRRDGWVIAVPDQGLFMETFGARTVAFRAGLELGFMNRALAAFSWMRSRWGWGVPDWLVRLTLWGSRALWPFGTDVGGMRVGVILRRNGKWQRRVWRMIVEGGDGPFIPAVPARVILRAAATIAPGARPALSVVPLAALVDGMEDLAVQTETVGEDVTPLFEGFLGASFEALPPMVRRLHDVPAPRRWMGQARVRRGTSVWSRVIAAVFGFPPATDQTPVTVTMTPQNGGELWERQFGTKHFWSFLKEKDGNMTERFGPFTFTLDLHVADGQLHFPVASGRFGPIPFPKALLPVSVAREYEAEERFHFDVALHAPITGALMVHYEGWLERAA